MKRLGANLFLFALIVSLLIHLVSGVVVVLKRVPARSEPIEVTIVDHKNDEANKDKSGDLKNDARQIVDQSEKRINEEKDEKAKYLSRFDQRVAHQTRATKTGKFQNDAKMGEAPKNPAQHLSEKPKKLAKNQSKNRQDHQLTDENGTVPLPKLSALTPQFHWDEVQNGVTDPGQQSQTDDHLKDVDVGPQTLLSTREFVYFSYYSRIKDRLRLFWEPKIKEKVNRIFAAGRHIASDEEKITRLVITLDRTGKLVRVQVMGESGLKDLDDAAVEAFQLAAPFPNPPKGIVDPDGTIKIRWDFILEAGSLLFNEAVNYV
jgi:TonB family protein